MGSAGGLRWWPPRPRWRWWRRARPAHRAHPHRHCRRRTRGRTEADSSADRLPPLHPRRRIAPSVLGARGAGNQRPALATRRARRQSRAVPASVAGHRRAQDQVAPAHCPTVGEPNRELLPTGRRRPAAEFRRSARKGRGRGGRAKESRFGGAAARRRGAARGHAAASTTPTGSTPGSRVSEGVPKGGDAPPPGNAGVPRPARDGVNHGAAHVVCAHHSVI